jgi:hypothetical protein
LRSLGNATAANPAGWCGRPALKGMRSVASETDSGTRRRIRGIQIRCWAAFCGFYHRRKSQLPTASQEGCQHDRHPRDERQTAGQNSANRAPYLYAVVANDTLKGHDRRTQAGSPIFHRLGKADVPVCSVNSNERAAIGVIAGRARTADASANAIPAEAEASSHHPRIERSCPNSCQRLLMARSAKSFGRSRSRSPYDARPALTAAAIAAVTRNVELL